MPGNDICQGISHKKTGNNGPGVLLLKKIQQNSFIRLSIFLVLLLMLLSFTACSNNSGGKKEELPTTQPPTTEPPTTQPPTTEPSTYNGSPFFDGFDAGKIDETVWRIATWNEHDGQTGRDRCYVKDGLLHLVFENDSTNGFLSAAIETKQEFLYGRWEARMKFAGLPRICNAMYTIDWDDKTNNSSGSDGTKQEIDIEFLTRQMNMINFAIHHQNIPADSFRVPDLGLDFDPAADFHVWGFDITPEKVQWFVDDKVLKTYTYSGNPIKINADYTLKFNTWSGVAWVTNGVTPPKDTPGHFLIDWVKFTPYTR